MLAACREAGIAPALIEVAEPVVEHVLLAVASGAGIALLPASVAGRYATAGVRFRPLAAPAPVCRVAVVARAEASTTTTAFLRLASQTRDSRRELRAVV
jgi:DNA-binding transcriptional LysR family regulator